MNGVFTDEFLEGILEAADIKKMDMISLFIGAVLDLVSQLDDEIIAIR